MRMRAGRHVLAPTGGYAGDYTGGYTGGYRGGYTSDPARGTAASLAITIQE